MDGIQVNASTTLDILLYSPEWLKDMTVDALTNWKDRVYEPSLHINIIHPNSVLLFI